MNKVLISLLKAAIAIAILALLYHNVSRAQVATIFLDVRMGPVFLFFCILFVNTLLSAWKWKLFLKADGVYIPLRHLFISYLIGTFFNLFLPSTIGGDTYRVFSVKQYSAKFSKSFASVFADRLTGFFALAFFGLVFSIIGYETLPHRLCFLVPLTVSIGLLGIATVIIYKPLMWKILGVLRLNRIEKARSFAEKFLNSFATYSKQPRLLAQVLGLSFLFQFLLILCIFILSKAIHLNVRFSDFFIFVPIVTLLEAIPISIYGLGLRDAGYVFFFTEIGLPGAEAQALSLSLLYVSISLLYACIGGVIFLVKLFFFNKSRAQEQALFRYSAGGHWDTDRSLTIGIMLRHIEERGGINVYSRNMLDHLLKADTHNKYLFFTPVPALRGKLRPFPNAEEVVVSTGRLPMRKLTWDQYHLLKPLGTYVVDVAFNPKLSVPLMAHCRTAFTMHGMEQFAASRYFMWHDRLYYTAAMELYCAKADAILVMTQTGKTDLQKYMNVPDYKIHVIPESYNEQCRRIDDAAELSRVKDEWDLPDKYVLFVGGITPLKNIPTLLRAFKDLKRRGFPHKLVLVGFRRWNFERDMALIESLDLKNDVVELGFVGDQDLPGIYNLADCFVLPSFYEGFGIPILEAQACGCPVVTSGCGGMREVAGDNAALHFDVTSPEHLTEQVATILADAALRESLIQKGLENVKRYSWDNTARQTIRVFNMLGRLQ